jgi:hypothetical protein
MRTLLLAFITSAILLGMAAAEDEPMAGLSFVVVRDYNGKPIRNAAVVMHPVDDKGRQERGGIELKTDPEGKASFDGIPYGTLRVQVLAHGFQTFGQDYQIDKPQMEITIKLKRPQGQYSIYEDHATDNKQPQEKDNNKDNNKDNKDNKDKAQKPQ